MRLLKRVGFGVAALAVATFMPASVDAASLTLTDDFGTEYTLEVEEGCTVCSVTITADYTDPTGLNGATLEAIQFKVDGNDPNDADLDSAPDGTWGTPVFANISGGPGGGCNGGDTQSVCTEGATVIANGDFLTWEFTVTFDEEVDLTAGNVRALYTGGNTTGNGYLFSPGGTDFGDGDGTGDTVVPEPASLLLLGLGALAAGRRARRRFVV